ncbi:hypothetical protein AAMO2058_000667700 [Amorphochlora amoebiformis]
MMFRRVSKIAIRRTGVRSVANWAYLSKTVGPSVSEAQTMVDEMQAEISKAPMKVPEIDWKDWEGKVGKAAVTKVKEFWEKKWLAEMKPSSTVTVGAKEIEELKQNCAAAVIFCAISFVLLQAPMVIVISQIADAQELEDWHRLRLRELEVEMAKIKDEINNIETLDVNDMAQRYPHINQRVDKEIEEGIYFKP